MRKFAWVSFIACSCTPQISAADYDQTCDANAECVVVIDGDVCGCNRTQTALNETAFEAFVDDKADLQSACGSQLLPPLEGSCLPLPPPTLPVCEDGSCVMPVDGEPCPVRLPPPCRGVD